MGGANFLKGNGRQVAGVVSGTLVAISDGIAFGWTAPMIPYLMSDESHLKITHSQGELVETMLLIGAFCGLPFTIFFVNRIGRKLSMQLSAVVATISWSLTCWAPNIEVLLAGRFLIGTAGNMCFVAAPMYIAEIADPKIRGFLSSLINLMTLCGMVIVYCVGPYAPYYTTAVIGLCLTSTQLVIFSFMPESAYYLVQKNKPDKAKQSLLFLRPKTDADNEIKEIEAAIERQKTENKSTGRPQDLLLVRSNRKAILIMTVLNGAEHFAGISVLLMNLHVILSEAKSVYLDTNLTGIIFAPILLVAATAASIMMDKFGRKSLLMVSSSLTAVCLLSLAVYYNLKNSGDDVSGISWIPAVAVMIYAAAFKLGLGSVPIVLTAEIFPQNIKAIGMTLADLIFVILSIASLQIYYVLNNAFGLQVPFYLFFGITSCVCLYTYYFIPETKGKTLDEIQQILEGKHKGGSFQAVEIVDKC